MPPPQKDLDIWAGNTFRRRFNFKQSDGSAFDLTGSKLVFKAVFGTDSLRKTTDVDDDGFDFIDETGGVVELFLTVAETRQLPEGSTRYEIERWADGDQDTMLYGRLNVTTWVNDDVDP